MDGLATVIAALGTAMLGILGIVIGYMKWAKETKQTQTEKLIDSMQKTIDLLRDECFRRMQSEAAARAELRAMEFRKEIQEHEDPHGHEPSGKEGEPHDEPPTGRR